MQQKLNDDGDIGPLPTGENVITTLAHADFVDPGGFGCLHAVMADAECGPASLETLLRECEALNRFCKSVFTRS